MAMHYAATHMHVMSWKGSLKGSRVHVVRSPSSLQRSVYVLSYKKYQFVHITNSSSPLEFLAFFSFSISTIHSRRLAASSNSCSTLIFIEVHEQPSRVMFICDVIAWEQFKCNWNKRNARDFVVVSLCSCSMFDLGFIICIFSRRAIVFYIRPCAIFVVEERCEGTRLFGVRCEMVDKKRAELEQANEIKQQNLRMLFNSATLTAH